MAPAEGASRTAPSTDTPQSLPEAEPARQRASASVGERLVTDELDSPHVWARLADVEVLITP